MDTTLSAFQGDATVRTRLTAQLAAHAGAGHLKPGPLFWNGTQGSLVGCLIDGIDMTAWQALGLPQWLAPIADALCADQLDAAAALGFGQALLQAIPVGANLTPVASRLICQFLDLARASLAPAMPDAALTGILADVAALHARAATGATDPAAWRSVRRAATAVTDTLEDPGQRTVADLAETAAWDPSRSRSALFDTVRVWRQLEDKRAMRDYGWGEAQDANMRALLQEMYDTWLQPELAINPASTLTVFTLLEQHHADEAARLRGMYRTQRETSAASTARATAMLLQALRDA